MSVKRFCIRVYFEHVLFLFGVFFFLHLIHERWKLGKPISFHSFFLFLLGWVVGIEVADRNKGRETVTKAAKVPASNHTRDGKFFIKVKNEYIFIYSGESQLGGTKEIFWLLLYPVTSGKLCRLSKSTFWNTATFRITKSNLWVTESSSWDFVTYKFESDQSFDYGHHFEIFCQIQRWFKFKLIWNYVICQNCDWSWNNHS